MREPVSGDDNDKRFLRFFFYLLSITVEICHQGTVAFSTVSSGMIIKKCKLSLSISTLLFSLSGLWFSVVAYTSADTHTDQIDFTQPVHEKERVALHTNLLYWASSTPNIGVQLPFSSRMSLAFTFGYNAFNFANYYNSEGVAANPKLHHWIIMPEGRYWIRSPFHGSYLGLHLVGGEFNIGGLKFPSFLKNNRYQGYLLGAGVSYGYMWRFAPHWALDFSIGVGYAHISYHKYRCGNCGKHLKYASKNYIGPTKAAISISYIFPSSGTSRKKPLNNLVVANPLYQDTIHTIIFDTIRVYPKPEDSINYKIQSIPDNDIINLRKDTAIFTIHYPVNVSEILPDYRQNHKALKRLGNLIDRLVKSSDGMSINSITITGFASPEHHYNYNTSLSISRAASVEKWINTRYDLPIPIETSGSSEDWEGLIKLLHSDSCLKASKIEVLSKTISDPDKLETEIKKLIGDKDYYEISSRLYPTLRHAVISVIYTTQSELN